MPFTRAQATDLLNKTEMRLYDDSRANALRGFDRAALAGRVVRTRAARDRARDLLKRQRKAARMRGEGKDEGIAARTARKEALLVELLERFVQARRNAPEKVAKKAAVKKAAPVSEAGKPPTRRVGADKAPSAKAAAKTRKTSPPSVAVAAPPDKAAARKSPVRKARKLSPERALENTRSLLDAKHERDQSPQPWQRLDPAAGQVSHAGYQSDQAAAKAQELHAGESRMASIHGSSSTRDRHNQGKRDNRGDND